MKAEKYGPVTITSRGVYHRVRWRERGMPRERTVRTREEARKLAVEVSQRLLAGEAVATAGSFGALIEKALDRNLHPSWGDRTYHRHRTIARIHLMPALGSRKAVSVTRVDAGRILNSLAAEGYSTHTVSAVKKTMVAACDLGVTLGVWPAHQSPTYKLKLPKVSSVDDDGDIELRPVRDDEIPTDDQARALIDTLWGMNPRYGFIAEVAAGCGLRWGEILGLRRGDIDLTEREIDVVRQWREVEGVGFELAPPKTAAGRRVTVIPTAAVPKLRPIVDRTARGAYIVATKGGNPIRRSNWATVMGKARERSGYPETLSVHSLRHYCATRWLRLGVPVADVSRMLGHSTVAITMRLYVHGDVSSVDRAKQLL
jgi:integrase